MTSEADNLRDIEESATIKTNAEMGLGAIAPPLLIAMATQLLSNNLFITGGALAASGVAEYILVTKTPLGKKIDRFFETRRTNEVRRLSVLLQEEQKSGNPAPKA